MVEKIEPSSSWNDKPTPKQVSAIAVQCLRLRIRSPLEETPRTRSEARNLLFRLRLMKKGGVDG